jgi:hypothetical protein
MDVLKMLADLRQERTQIEEAIITLEGLASGRGKRCGHPPAWMKTVSARSGEAGRQAARNSPRTKQQTSEVPGVPRRHLT